MNKILEPHFSLEQHPNYHHFLNCLYVFQLCVFMVLNVVFSQKIIIIHECLIMNPCNHNLFAFFWWIVHVCSACVDNWITKHHYFLICLFVFIYAKIHEAHINYGKDTMVHTMISNNTCMVSWSWYVFDDKIVWNINIWIITHICQ